MKEFCLKNQEVFLQGKRLYPAEQDPVPEPCRGFRHAIAVDRESQDARSKRGKTSSLLARLTPRQRQVMELLVAGKPNKIVAAELGLSPKTVEVHRARVMAKLEVESFAELVRLSLDRSA